MQPQQRLARRDRIAVLNQPLDHDAAVWRVALGMPVTDDDHRARGVLGDGETDGPEEQAGHPAVPAGPEHEDRFSPHEEDE